MKKTEAINRLKIEAELFVSIGQWKKGLTHFVNGLIAEGVEVNEDLKAFKVKEHAADFISAFALPSATTEPVATVSEEIVATQVMVKKAAEKAVKERPKPRADKKRLFFDGVNSNTTEEIDVYGIYLLRDDKGQIVYAPNSIFRRDMPVLQTTKGEDGKPCMVKYPIPVYSPVYRAWKEGKISIMALLEDDQDLRAELFKVFLASLYAQGMKTGVFRTGIYNYKQNKAYAIYGTREELTEFYGDDILAKYENPFKIAPLGMGPSTYVFRPDMSDISKLKIALINQEQLATVLTDPEFKDVAGGEMVGDGNFFLNVETYYRKYNFSPTKQKNADFVKGFAAQIRALEPGVIKAKFCIDYKQMNKVLKRNGLEHLIGKVDGVGSIGNMKTWPEDWKHGQVIEINVDPEDWKGLRIVQQQIPDNKGYIGKSSIGPQAIRSDIEMIRKLLVEKGAVEEAKLLKLAVDGDVEAFEKILAADKDETLGDALKMYVEYISMSKKDSSMPSGYRIPCYEPANNVRLVRLLSFYQRQVKKVVSDMLSFKIQTNPDLDVLELKHYLKTGEHINYVMFPGGNKKTREHLTEKQFVNVGRNPWVGPANLQGATFVRDENGNIVWNHTTDTIYVSAKFGYSMFADDDGDPCLVCTSNVAFFPVIRRTMPPVEPPKSKYMTNEEYAKLDDWYVFINIVNALNSSLDALANTGIADNTSRAILITARTYGVDIPADQLLRMAEVCELMIQKMKRKSGKTADVTEDELLSVADSLVNSFWPLEGKKLYTGPYAHNEVKLQTKDAGKGRFSKESEIMAEFIKLFNKTKSICEMNPYDVVYNELRGCKFVLDHSDSTRIKKFFEDQWKAEIGKLSKKGEVVDGKFIEYGFSQTFIAKFCAEVDGYVRIAKDKARAISDTKARKKEFALIAEDVRNAIADARVIDNDGNSVPLDKTPVFYDIFPIDLRTEEEKKHDETVGRKPKYSCEDVFIKYCTLYFGKTGFGCVPKKDRTGDTSLGGSVYFLMPENFLIAYARILDPENPFALKAQIALPKIIEKRQKQEEARRERELAKQESINGDIY